MVEMEAPTNKPERSHYIFCSDGHLYKVLINTMRKMIVVYDEDDKIIMTIDHASDKTIRNVIKQIKGDKNESTNSSCSNIV